MPPTTPHLPVDLPDWPHEIDLFPNCLAAACARLDEAAFAVAWEQGRGMTLPKAVAYALQTMD